MTAVRHLEILVEEQSTEAALRELLPKVFPADGPTWAIYPSQGKQALLRKLPERLRGYSRWLPADTRVLVVVDRDDEDCVDLKQRLETFTREAGLRSRSSVGDDSWQVVNRIACEELEAWFLGDPDAMREAFPRLSPSFDKKQGYRQPDAIAGGTWEAMERLLQEATYHPGGLQKVAAARAIAACMVPGRNRSPSFRALWAVLTELAPASPSAGPEGVQEALPLPYGGGPELARLPPRALSPGNVWLTRVLWGLEWARRAGLGPLRAADVGRILRDQAGVTEGPNVARAFRDHARVALEQGLWVRSDHRFSITAAGTARLQAVIAGTGAGLL